MPVRLELNVQNRFVGDSLDAFNIVAELPGTDKAAEVVMLGAHFDSWHSGTGAVDNAAGSAAMMEAMRILKATGLRLRRTVRLVLWTGEEQGLLGSQAYVKEHFGDPATMTLKPEHARVSAYFNMDNGAGAIRGVYLQGNEAVRPIFATWMEPFRSLGMTTMAIRSVASTDHRSLDAIGIPAFQFIQDPLDYGSNAAPHQQRRLRAGAAGRHDEERRHRRVVRLSRRRARRAAAAQAAAAPAAAPGRPRSKAACRWRCRCCSPLPPAPSPTSSPASLAARELADARAASAAELAAARQDNQWLRHELERQQASLGATQALLDKAELNLREAFQSLAAEALNSNRGAFLDLARTAFEGLTKQSTAQMDARKQAIDALVQPLTDTMKQVHDRLGAVEKERTASFAQLAEQIAALGTTTHTLVARAAHALGARPLGRDAAAPRRRARRHAAPLRLRGAAGPVVRRGPPAPRSHRPAAARQEHRRGRQGAARSVSRRAGGQRRRGRASNGCRRTRAASASTWNGWAARPTGSRSRASRPRWW